MRNMSFSLTKGAFLDGSKDVTRRIGWLFLKPGDRVRAVEKAMGLRKGEKIKPLGEIEIVSAERERLNRIVDRGAAEVRREGFDMTPREFVEMFCSHMGCEPKTWITRIEFRRIEP